MDLARLASRFGLAELPELVRMEREIEALEAADAAAAAAAKSSSVGTMAEERTKVDASVYASRVAERKLSMTSAVTSPSYSPGFASSSLSSPSSENDFYDYSIASTNTEPVIRYCSTNTVGTTAVEVLVDVSTDAGEEDKEDKSLDAGKTDSSTLVERMSLDGTSTTATNTLMSDATDASCQANVNNSSRGVSAGKKSTNNNANTVTVFVDIGESGDAVDKPTRTATLPPLKASQTTPRVKPRGAKKTPTLTRGNTGTNSRIDVVKRSTSAADLRELGKSQAKRRNTREGRDGATQRGHQVKSQVATKSTATVNNTTSASQQTRSRSQVRTPLADRNQVSRMTTAKSQPPHSVSSSSKLSSGFASHSSSCSDLAAEVRKQTAHCTCCARNRLIRLDEGRYQMGSRIYYLRRFHSHVMVRVGGGWLTLNQFLDRYDPCRQKEGELQSITSSNSHINGEVGPMVRVTASNILKAWPSEEVLKTNSR
ncbi:unnamed protein product [Taenia asiatica]|uniref:GAR domain-containing protein n=1 Tax=Taenia asiatica TaxID=60517 RepID=A0A0R3VVI9_TAEAS|nr:unnamed protein product [Taenia asiatica]